MSNDQPEGQDIFVLFDGTKAQWVDGTNIQKIDVLAEGSGYKTRYRYGIGTVTRTKIRDKVFAPNMETEAAEMYTRLLDMQLTQNDRLYIVGYSRGAVVARILAKTIASNEARKVMFGINGDTRSIPATIQFLGLIDPVAGWPRLKRRKVRDHEVVIDGRIQNYFEIVALNDFRPHFRSDAYWASKGMRTRLLTQAATSTVQSTEDRMNAFRQSSISKTRLCVWFPGGHSDAGAQGGDEFIGTHTLLTTLDQAIKASRSNDRPLKFNTERINELLLLVAELEDAHTSKSKISHFVARHVFPAKSRNRKAQVNHIIPHLKHPLCRKLTANNGYNQRATQNASEYPDYPDIRKAIEQ